MTPEAASGGPRSRLSEEENWPFPRLPGNTKHPGSHRNRDLTSCQCRVWMREGAIGGIPWPGGFANILLWVSIPMAKMGMFTQPPSVPPVLLGLFPSPESRLILCQKQFSHCGRLLLFLLLRPESLHVSPLPVHQDHFSLQHQPLH